MVFFLITEDFLIIKLSLCSRSRVELHEFSDWVTRGLLPFLPSTCKHNELSWALHHSKTILPVSSPDTALTVHIPFYWVHWHGNNLQRNPSSGNSNSVNACAEVLLLGHQPCRQQWHHTEGAWWVIINFLDMFWFSLFKVYHAVKGH